MPIILLSEKVISEIFICELQYYNITYSIGSNVPTDGMRKR
jgi:hypothetical protein